MCGAVVLMVIVVVTGLASVIATDAGMEQVGAVAAVEDVFGAQVRFTVPVKPPAGVMVSVDVFPVVMPGAEIVTGVPETEKGKTMATENLTVWGA